MSNDLISSEISRIRSGGTGEREKHNIGKIDGRVKNGKSAMQKFTDAFFEEDFKTVRNGLVTDIIKPTIKSFIADIFIGGIERALYGSTNTRRYNRNIGNGITSSLVRNYANASYASGRAESYYPSSPDTYKPKKFTFEDVVMVSRPKAQELLDILKQAIEDYGNVSISELYDALDVTDNLDYTDNYFGWTDLSHARIVKVNKGWWIDFPTPEQLR